MHNYLKFDDHCVGSIIRCSSDRRCLTGCQQSGFRSKILKFCSLIRTSCWLVPCAQSLTMWPQIIESVNGSHYWFCVNRCCWLNNSKHVHLGRQPLIGCFSFWARIFEWYEVLLFLFLYLLFYSKFFLRQKANRPTPSELRKKRTKTRSMSMFDKFHVTFNIKSKVSRDVLKNKTLWLLHFISILCTLANQVASSTGEYPNLKTYSKSMPPLMMFLDDIPRVQMK